MDQEPAYLVARFVYECMQHRRTLAEDFLPYFNADEVGVGYLGQVYDSFSSGLGYASEEFPSHSDESSISMSSAHGAYVGSLAAAPFGGAIW